MSDWKNPPTGAPRGGAAFQTGAGLPATASNSGVLRPRLTARHVDLRRWPAPPGLSRWVENYWGLRWNLPDDTAYSSQVLPHPACTISVERATRPREGVPPRATLVTGVVTRRFDVRVAGAGTVFGVKFRPGGLAHLLGATAREWTDRTIDASVVLPSEVVEQLAAVEPVTLHADGPGPVEPVLLALVNRPVGRNEERYDLLLRIVSDMLTDRTLVTVGHLSARYGVAERTLQRWFGAYVGVGPKWILGRYRMHDVVSEIDAGYAGPLAELAHRYGWYDQAHFIRDFKSLVGVSPSAYATSGGASTPGRG